MCSTTSSVTVASGRPSPLVSRSSGRTPSVAGPAGERVASSGIVPPPVSVKLAAANVAGEEIHRRAADERADEAVGRPLVDVHRRVDLLDDAVVHQHDPLAERHRFDLVVRDVDDRRLEPLVQAGDLGPHLHAELGVEIRERLVEQKHLRLADDGPAERDALPLAAGKLARPAIEQRFDREDLGRLADAAFDFGRGVPRIFRPNAMFWWTDMCG